MAYARNTFLYGGYYHSNSNTTVANIKGDHSEPRLLNQSNYWGNQSIGYSRHEDPLMLGFTIEFDFDTSPLFLYTKDTLRMTPRQYCSALNDIVNYNNDKKVYREDDRSEVKWHSWATQAQYYDVNVLDSGKMCSAAEYLFLNQMGAYTPEKPMEQQTTTEAITPAKSIELYTKLDELNLKLSDKKNEYVYRLGIDYDTKEYVDDPDVNSNARLKDDLRDTSPSFLDKIEQIQNKILNNLAIATEVVDEIEDILTQIKTIHEILKDDETVVNINPQPQPTPIPPHDDFYVDPALSNLIRANRMFYEISNNHPYMFQAITGLDTLVRDYYDSENSTFDSGDNTITVECLESVDFKLSKTFHMYKDSIWDSGYMRDRIPSNLRKFNCRILLHDLRSFNNYLSLTGYISERMKEKILDPNYINASEHSISSMFAAAEHMGCFEILLFGCEFTRDMGSQIWSSPRFDTADPVNTQFAFSWDKCYIDFVDFAELVDVLDMRYEIPGKPKQREPGIRDLRSLANAVYRNASLL